jgi:hypothetical protein
MGLIANLLKMAQSGGGGGGYRGGGGGGSRSGGSSRGGSSRGGYGRSGSYRGRSGRPPADEYAKAQDFYEGAELKDLNQSFLSVGEGKDPQGWGLVAGSMTTPEDVARSEALIGTSDNADNWNATVNLLHGLISPGPGR